MDIIIITVVIMAITMETIITETTIITEIITFTKVEEEVLHTKTVIALIQAVDLQSHQQEVQLHLL